MSQLEIARGYTSTTIFTEAMLDATKTAVEALVNGNIDYNNIQDGALTTTEINASAITTAKLATDSVSTAAINTGAITRAKRASVNIAYSSGSSTTSASNDDVKILSTSITTLGNPVFITLMNSAATESYVEFSITEQGVQGTWEVRFYRDTTLLSTEPLGFGEVTSTGGVDVDTITVRMPPGCFKIIDSPPAGSYTYTVVFNLTGVDGSWALSSVKMAAYEL